MNEHTLYDEIRGTFKWLGGYARKAHDAYFRDEAGALSKEKTADLATPEIGVSDYICLIPPLYGAAVEAKYDAANFNLSRIKPEQRAFLDKHEPQGYLWLGMGQRIGGKDQPRLNWLIPWTYWKKVEDVLQHYNLKGLPYSPHVVELRGLVDAPVLLRPYVLKYDSALKVWTIPESHPIYALLKGQTNG
jgi:hypothetical protein